jgi:hypothetical protein
MPRLDENRLTKTNLKTLDKRTGRHPVANHPGLYLAVRSPALRYWTHRFRVAGRQTELSLGPYPEVPLDEALAKHAAQRAQVMGKVDPIEAKRTQRKRRSGETNGAELIFKAAAADYLETHGHSWTNVRHYEQWRTSLLKGLCNEILGPMPISKIDTDDVLRVLKPLWKKTPQSASRLRNRIEAVIASGYVRLKIDRGNPARWKNHLKTQLGKLPAAKNFVAMPYADVPAFIADLRQRKDLAAPALEFLVLTAVRAGEGCLLR